MSSARGTSAREAIEGELEGRPPSSERAPVDPVAASASDDEDTPVTVALPIGVEGAAESKTTATPSTNSDAPASKQTSSSRSAEVRALDRAIPVRRRASVDGAPLRAAFLLSHVDNRMTVAQIAASAQIPLSDAVESFELLADLGVVELRTATPQPSKTGLHPKS